MTNEQIEQPTPNEVNDSGAFSEEDAREHDNEQSEDSMADMLEFFKSNYIQPYEDGCESHFRKGAIADITADLEEVKLLIAEEGDADLEKSYEKVRALGYDAVIPFTLYFKQSIVLAKEMGDLRDYVLEQLGHLTSMGESVDNSFEGFYKKLLNILEKHSYKEIVETAEFQDKLIKVREGMGKLIECRENIRAKDEVYKNFEKEAYSLIFDFGINLDGLSGGPKNPNEVESVPDGTSRKPINGQAVKELKNNSDR
jgi:hypothetical protein